MSASPGCVQISRKFVFDMVSSFLCSGENCEKTCATCSNKDNSDLARAPKVYLTGFGPFGDIAKNPSDEICKDLAESLRISVPVERSGTIEVSEAYVNKHVSQMNISENDIVIHFGVAESSDRIYLECRAINDKTFPIPDVQGNKPDGRILKEYDEFVYTSLPVPELACSIRDNGYLCDISYDAGTYLCNYLYFRSLLRLKSRRVLFVHIPKFEVMSKDCQLQAFKLMFERLDWLIRRNQL